MVDLSFISARFLCADNADDVVPAPRVNDPGHLCIDPAQSNPSRLAVIFPVVDALQHLVLKDGRSREKRDQMLLQVGSGLSLIPLKCEVQASPLDMIQKRVHKRVHVLTADVEIPCEKGIGGGMSKTVKIDLNCPQCQASFQATLYRTIWVESQENMKLIETDQINLVHCPACGLSEMPPFPFMATNVRKNIAIWYEPIPDNNIDSDIALYSQHFGADSVYASAQRIRDWKQFKNVLAQLNNLPDVESTTEDLAKFRRGMRSAYALQKGIEPKLTPKEEMFAKLVSGLRQAGHTVPYSVSEIPDFPWSTFVALKESISRNELALYCPTLSYNSDIFRLLAKRTESFRFAIATVMMYVMPIIFVLLAIFVFWLWVAICPLALFAGWKLGRSTYREALVRSAMESENKFCFLFYSYKIGVAELPDMSKAYVWQGSYPSSPPAAG